MWLSPLFANPLLQDLVATVVTFAVALLWLRLNNMAAARGWVAQTLSRKLVHTGTGPLFVLCWNLFSQAPAARFFAALVPLAITAQFVLVGLEVIRDPAAVQSMSRSGDPREILRGPLYYGIIFVLSTVIFWRGTPTGIIALMILCGGDGLADVVGRRFGRRKLPWAAGKSWAGSLAMFAGSFGFALAFVTLFSAMGYFDLPAAMAAAPLALICLVATAVESLPVAEVDNITVFLAGLATILLLSLLPALWPAPFLGSW